MSYSEENGQVVLTMSREDYLIVLRALGSFTAPVAAYSLIGEKDGLNRMLDFMNRLNQGNPNYTPYQVGEKS